MGDSTRLRHAVLTAALFNLVGLQGVWGAETDTTPAAASDALEEITVTAERREETAQKTPVSINVYSAGEIAQKDLVNLESLAQLDPNLIFNRSGGEATLAVRGITTNNTTEIGNPAVPVGVDDFFVNRAAALDAMLFDVQRIEVLLGPQGTLFGRSAVGGVVNITTNKPTKDFEAGGSLELGNYQAVNATGALNLPLSDWLQVRVAVSSREHQGYRVNTYDPAGGEPVRGDDEDSHAGRVTAMFEPSDQFTGWVSYQLETEGGTGYDIRQIPFTYLPDGDISHQMPNLGSPNAWPTYGPLWQDIEDRVTKWHLAYTGIPGGITATLLGGYDTFDWRHSDGGISFFPQIATPGNIFLPSRPFVQNEAPVTLNDELRFTSAPTGLVTWQGGLYYFHEANTLVSEGIENAGTPQATPLLTFNYHVETRSEAAYAQGAIHFTDQTALSVGARYSRDDLVRTGLFSLPLFGIPPGPSGDGRYFSNRVTGHVGFDYNWTPANLLYAKVDTGYKPGGLSSCANFKSEDVTTGEIGSKNRWLNDTLQFNAAVFHSDYKNEQVTQFISSCDTGSIVTNAGKSTIYGLESDLKWLVQPVGTFDVGFEYLHAVYDTLALPPNNGTPGLQSCSRVDSLGNCILDGNTMPTAPKVVLSAGAEHVWDLSPGDIDLRVEGRYTSKIYFDPFNYADTTEGGYTLFNAYLTYKRDNWSIGAYGRNLANRAYLIYAQEQTSGGAEEYDYAYGSPRVFGVRFEAQIK